MKVLITGANGMVARALAAHCRSIGDDVIALTHGELDIADREKALELIEAERPDAVLNCAAFTNVDGAESDQQASHKANVDGPENLALACKAVDAAFVTISTDYVFDGENTGFYTQRDTPNPLGVYGRTKLEGERRATNAYARSIIVRSGWIYGSGGTNFLSVMPQLLADGKSIKAIYDSYGTPTYAGDLAVRICELAVLDMPCIYHVTNAGPGASFEEFAEKVCEIGGFERSLLEPVSKDALKRPAPRPAYSKLACLFSDKFGLKPLRNWEDALKDYLTIYGS